MKKTWLLAGAALLTAILSACASNEGTRAPAPAGGRRAAPYYTGDGGKGMSLAVLTPTGNGLSQAENYLPALVQGVLAGDFTKFSEIEIFDRQNLDKIVAEMESGLYTESEGVVKYGEKVPARYLLSGELVKGGGGYVIKLAVSDTKTGETKASYSGSADRQSIDDFSAIKKASEELLAQLGIHLSNAGKQALYGTGTKAIAAETALARGVNAQRGGSTVAAFNYLTEAAFLNAGLPEADARLAALTRHIETGDIGDGIRNDIARRSAWKDLLEEALVFYEEHPPFDVVYRNVPERGNVNYEKNTAELSFQIWLESNARCLALHKLLNSLSATGKMEEWQLRNYFSTMLSGYGNNWYYFAVEAELLDGAGNYLDADKDTRLEAEWWVNNNIIRKLTLRASSLSFTVDAQKINGALQLGFKAAGMQHKGQWNQPVRKKNVLDNTLIKATDKTFQEYFSGKRNYEVRRDDVYYAF